MNLTDDHIRSLRKRAEDAIAKPGLKLGGDEYVWAVDVEAAELLSLVEEVLRCRQEHS